MYELECLTINTSTDSKLDGNECQPFWRECYPIAEGHCGPECNPV